MKLVPQHVLYIDSYLILPTSKPNKTDIARNLSKQSRYCQGSSQLQLNLACLYCLSWHYQLVVSRFNVNYFSSTDMFN